MALLEFHFLVVFESSGEFPKIFSESVIFESKFIDVLAITLDMINNCFVSQEQIELGLEPVVFFVDEVNLGIQFGYNLLVVLLEILHGQFFVVLTALVELAKPENLTVSNLNTLFELLNA